MSYVTSLYHVVFTTYCRRPAIDNTHRDDLYHVLASEIRACKSKAHIIGGVQDHLHILLSLSPQVALSNLMREIKSKSSVWAKGCGMFPLFEGWEREYGAFSLSYGHRDAVYDYIASQQKHHDTISLDDEYRRLITKAGLQIYGN